jgi:pyridoxal phosphate enzyme (YggS family)
VLDSSGGAVEDARPVDTEAAHIAERLRAVRARVAEAAVAAGRDPSTVRLVAVSKLQPAAAVAAALAAGQRDFGENYAQELRDKARALAGATWHFLGPLQRNKVKYVVGVAELIHSLDGASLADEIARRAEAMGLSQPCLIEVNLGGEPQKPGCAEEQLPSLVDAIRERAGLRLDGLMCIPPAATADDPEQARAHFRRLRELRDAERERTGLPLAELSMGMSADFAVAIAEGATLVRIGTAIFGERAK